MSAPKLHPIDLADAISDLLYDETFRFSGYNYQMTAGADGDNDQVIIVEVINLSDSSETESQGYSLTVRRIRPSKADRAEARHPAPHPLTPSPNNLHHL